MLVFFILRDVRLELGRERRINQLAFASPRPLHAPAWRSLQEVLNFSYLVYKIKKRNKKLQPDSNILASPEAGRGNCLPFL